MKRFIGGISIEQAYRHMMSRLTTGMIPIYDYAKEGTMTYSQSKTTFHKIHKDIQWLNQNSIHQSWSYALKLSSVLHYNPFVCLSFLIQNSKGPIFLDAEQDAMKHEEQVYYPFLLQQQSVSKEPIHVYKTYQMYRKDAFDELIQDVHRYPRLGIKLVRGAYIHTDKHKNILWPTIHQTHTQYNKAIRFLCSEEIHKKRELAVVFATHNRISIELILHLINKKPFLKHHISTAQLLGMRDDFSQLCVSNQIKVYKYVPYGQLLETYPYLIRRLIENMKLIEHMV